MVMTNVVLYLLHQRDIIDKMITLDICDPNDFEWQSKFKVFWHEDEQARKLGQPEGVYV